MRISLGWAKALRGRPRAAPMGITMPAVIKLRRFDDVRIAVSCALSARGSAVALVPDLECVGGYYIVNGLSL
jgi:hypothetical protein